MLGADEAVDDVDDEEPHDASSAARQTPTLAVVAAALGYRTSFHLTNRRSMPVLSFLLYAN